MNLSEKLSENWKSVLILFNGSFLILFLFFPLSINPVLYLSSSCFLSYFFFKKKDFTYILFLLWLFFLYAFFRRLHDFHFGRNEQNVVLLAPVLSGIWPFLDFLLNGIFKKKLDSLLINIFLMFLCVLYGLFYSILSLDVSQILTGIKMLLGFISGFSIFIYLINARINFDQIIEKIIFQGKFFLIVFGFYGLNQFSSLPSWDQKWLDDGGLASAIADGSIRIWGTLSAPGLYACVNFFFLFLLIAFLERKKDLSFLSQLAIIMGFILVIVSQVRVLLIFMFFALLFLKKKQKKIIFRILLSLSVILLLFTFFGVFLGKTELIDILIKRYSTLGSIEDDGSFNARKGLFTSGINLIYTYPLGSGLHSAHFESGLLSLFVALGVPVGSLYYISYLSFLSKLFSRKSLRFATLVVPFVIMEILTAFYGSNPFWSFLAFFSFGMLVLEKKSSNLY